MPTSDCGFCAQLIDCDAFFQSTDYFNQLVAKLLCEIADNTGSIVVEVSQAGAPNIATNQVAIAATAGGTQIVPANATRRRVTIVALEAFNYYIGDPGLTIATGTLLAPIVGASLTINTTAAVYGIVASGPHSVSFIEEYD